MSTYIPNISLIEFSQTLVQATGVVPLVVGAIGVGVGVGVIAWIGLAILSGVQSWQMRRAERPVER